MGGPVDGAGSTGGALVRAAAPVRDRCRPPRAEVGGLRGALGDGLQEAARARRRFASLDHLSQGRAGWNIVTTANPDAALNFGLDDHVEHDELYRRAREFCDVVTGLWDSFADDAFVRDVDAGLYFEPRKLHVLEHKGKHLSVRGPLNIASFSVAACFGANTRGQRCARTWG
jgi:hypothetical protein